jgi:hypothetical protein
MTVRHEARLGTARGSPVAEANPVTVVVNAARGLILGTADAGTVLLALGWIAGIVAVFAPLAIWTYRRRVGAVARVASRAGPVRAMTSPV